MVNSKHSPYDSQEDKGWNLEPYKLFMLGTILQAPDFFSFLDDLRNPTER